MRIADLPGSRTCYIETGSGGVPLVLLHGVLSDSSSWSGIAEGLARGRRVLAPDMPMHGGTVMLQGFSPGPEGMVSWLEALLDHAGVQTADLCGLSMGGAVAAHTAMSRPERVRRLVLVDAAAVVPISDPYSTLIEEARQQVEAILRDTQPPRMGGWSNGLALEGDAASGPQPGSDPLVASVLEFLDERGITLDQAASGLRLLAPLGEEDLSSIQATTMVVWGREDPFFQAELAEEVVRRALPGARIVVVDGAGHNPIKDAPELFLTLLEDFLR